MMSDRWRSRLEEVVAPALLVVLPLCLFGPYTIFSGNEAEFSAPFWVLVRPLLLAGAGIALALIAVGIVLPDKLFRAYVVLLFSVGLVIWIQGNLLVADYGAFTGVPIDWTIESWRNPYEIALWIAVPVLGVVAAKYVVRIAPFASGVLVALQAAALITSVVRADSSDNRAMARADRVDVRAVPDAQRDPHRARCVPVGCVRRNPGGRAAAVRPQPVRRRVLRESHRCVPDDDRQHTGNADWKGLSQRSAVAAIRARHPEGSLDLQVSPGERLSRRCCDGHASRQRIGDELLSPSAAICELRRVRTVHRLAACGSVAVQARAAHIAARHSQRRIVAASGNVRARRYEHAPAPLGQWRCRARSSLRSASDTSHRRTALQIHPRRYSAPAGGRERQLRVHRCGAGDARGIQRTGAMRSRSGSPRFSID